MPASKGAKLKNVGESIVVSDPTARALLDFLCRGCSPQDQGFGSPLNGCHPLSSQQAASCFCLPVFRPVAFFTPTRRGYFPLRSFWVHRFFDPIVGAGPSLQQRVCTFPKRRVTPVPSRCLLKVVAARVVAQLFSLTLPWICRCSVRRMCLVFSGCSPLLVSSFLLCGLALPLVVRVLCVQPVSCPSLLSCLSHRVSRPVIVHWCCGFHDLWCGRSHECHNQNPSYPR